MKVTEIVSLLHKSVLNKTYDFVPTEKNRNSRRKYGLTIIDIEDFLLTINEEDLYRGPEEDRDYKGEYIYIFKKELINGIYFYIKIKKDNKKNRIKILSCHEDEK